MAFEPTWWMKEGKPMLVLNVSFNTDYTNEEHEVAVIELTPWLAVQILNRVALVKRVKAEDGDVNSIEFYNNEVEFWPCNADDEPMCGEPRWDLEAGRTEGDYLEVGDTWFRWRAFIKNTDIELYAETLTEKDLRAYLEGNMVWAFGDPKAFAVVHAQVEKWLDNPANANLLR